MPPPQNRPATTASFLGPKPPRTWRVANGNRGEGPCQWQKPGTRVRSVLAAVSLPAWPGGATGITASGMAHQPAVLWAWPLRLAASDSDLSLRLASSDLNPESAGTDLNTYEPEQSTAISVEAEPTESLHVGREPLVLPSA